ncbi:DedA family protein [Ramlibacter rhizophilus]|uniref:DedA family protein n=1 Tax=Ramlibacter rhizophilus TaxID=1781167 RepID=UPI00143253AF|nr:VTT domain-containing protein [Ramlibacter rhizophilus]
MNLTELALDNGYLLLALGLVVEGETAVLLATLAAHRGWLQLPLVFGMAFAVAWLLDQSLYWLGRWKGVALLARWRRLARAAVRARRLVLRHPHASVIGVRFAYGLRTAGPMLIGASGLPAWQFALLSALAAALWAGILCTLGWVFAQALQQVLQYAQGVQLGLLALLVLAGLSAWWMARRRRRLRGR